MKKVWNSLHRQYKIAIFLLIFNIDWVLIPLLRLINCSNFVIAVVVIPLSGLELFLWYKFWEWFRYSVIPKKIEEQKDKLIEKSYIQESIKEGMDIKEELERKGFVTRIQNWFLKTYHNALNEESVYIKSIKRFGHVSMFFLGIDPLPFGRTIGFVFCGSIRWRGGLWTLIVGNVLHTLQLIAFWNLMSAIWDMIWPYIEIFLDCWLRYYIF